VYWEKTQKLCCEKRPGFFFGARTQRKVFPPYFRKPNFFEQVSKKTEKIQRKERNPKFCTWEKKKYKNRNVPLLGATA
jgi:hypothetical protein